EEELDRIGDSLLVVGDSNAIKVHVHTDDPGAALSIGSRAGTIDRIEIANMHEQTLQREERLLAVVPDPPPGAAGVVAVVAGGGNFDEVSYEVVERLLSEPRELLTLLVGQDKAPLAGLLGRIAVSHPDIQVGVQEGGQPHYHLLLSAE